MWKRSQQTTCVRMTWVIKQRIDTALFHIASRIHHIDSIRHSRNNAKVMSNQHNGSPKRFLNSLNHFQNLCLNCHIQRRCWFVSNENFRVICYRYRNHNPLTHASRELVRVLMCSLRSLRYADNFKQFNSTIRSILFTQIWLVRLQHFNNLIANAVNGIER